MRNINVGDMVQETGTDSGCWRVIEIYKNSLRKTFAAKLELHGHPNCTTHVSIEKLTKLS